MLEQLIEKLLCKHEYVREANVRYEDSLTGEYIEVLYQCKKCGKFKKVRL